jgi:hypothetical protein
LAKPAGRPGKDPREVELAQLRSANERLAKQLDTAQRVIEVQGKLSAVLEDLATEAATSDANSTSSGRGN